MTVEASSHANGINRVNGMGGESDSHTNGLNGVNGKVGEINGLINGVNGDISTSSINGSKINGHQQQVENITSVEDVPVPTANGGYTHTSSSRAKISAANKGKTPWNKGQVRSEETKAKIAEGVRRRNRERFLAKLEAEGITEEEHHERKKTERRKKDAERRARKTSKGGYTPTEETKRKISRVLKEKYATGDVKRKPRDPSKVRRGFKHTEETKQKIRESLRRKWAEDTEYRDLMTNKTIASGVGSSIRKRISETLKRRWEDPEFRAKMMSKFANRKSGSGARDESHRQKISAAMKRKWLDEEYRQRATEGMAKGREAIARKNNAPRPVRPVQPKMPTMMKGTEPRPATAVSVVQPLKAVSPMTSGGVGKKKSTRTTAKKSKSPTAPATKKRATAKRKGASSDINGDSGSAIAAVEPRKPSPVSKKKAPKEKKKELPKDGSISRMREERRDLYDLLYGDEDEEDRENRDSNAGGGSTLNGEQSPPGILASGMIPGVASDTMAALLADDDDLDDFDPYGLQMAPP